MLPAHQMTVHWRRVILEEGGRHVFASKVSGMRVRARATNTRGTRAAASRPAVRIALACGSAGKRGGMREQPGRGQAYA